MTKILYLFCFFQIHGFVHGQDSLHIVELMSSIDSAHEAGNYNYVKKNAKTLFLKTQFRDDLFELRIKSLTFLLEAYFLTADYKNVTQDIIWIEQEYKRYESELKQDRLRSPGMYKLVYAYNFFQHENAKYQMRTSSAIKYALHNLDHVIKHTEYYTPVRSLNTELQFTRLWQTYSILGKSYIQSHDYQQAFVCLSQAINYGRRVDQIDSATYSGRIWGREQSALIEMMKLSSTMGNIQLVNEAYSTFRDSKLPIPLAQEKLKEQLKFILKNPAIAKELKTKAIIQLKAIPYAEEDPRVIVVMAEFYESEHNYKSLIRELEVLQLVEKKQGLHPGVKSQMHLLRARLAKAKGDYKGMERELSNSIIADVFAQAPLHPSEAHDSKYEYVKTLNQSISCYYDAYHQSKSIQFLEKVLRLADAAYKKVSDIRHNLFSDKDRILMIREISSMIDVIVQSAYLIQSSGFSIDYNLVLQYLEINKSYNLRNEAWIKNQFSNEAHRSLFDKIQFKINRLEQIITKPASLSDTSLNALSDLYNLRQKTVQANIPHELKVPNCAEVQSKLKPEECLISFYVGKNILFALVVAPDTVHLYRLGASEDDPDILRSDLHHFFQSINIDHPMPDAVRDSIWSSASFNLFSVLIEPLHIFRFKSICIVPDGPLNRLPFAALLTEIPVTNKYKQWPFLIHKFKISTQHSIGLWMDYNFLTAPIKAKTGILAFAPSFDNLTFNVQECEEIKHQMDAVKTVLGNKASCKNLSEWAINFNILHVASHAYSDIHEESQSMIRGYRDTLFLQDIATQQFSQDLVFLSACETGYGKIVSEEGVMSLARSFFLAGARSVISTLWKINDRISKDQVLMVYQELKAGLCKDQAIQNMQLHFILDDGISSKYAMPYYWAAYQCQGDLQPLDLENRSKNWIWSVFLAMIAFIGLGYFIFK